MDRTITNKFEGSCHKCGHPLHPGDRVRWSGRGRIFCLSVHGHGGQTKEAIRTARNMAASQAAWDHATGNTQGD